MFETPNDQIMEFTEAPEAFDELVNVKQVSMQVVYEILVCLMTVAVVMYVICCINTGRLLCEEYLSRASAQETNQESHELNDISIVRFN